MTEIGTYCVCHRHGKSCALIYYLCLWLPRLLSADIAPRCVNIRVILMKFLSRTILTPETHATFVIVDINQQGGNVLSETRYQ